MSRPSIYQIIEFLHEVGKVVPNGFLSKTLTRQEMENFLKRDVSNLNALDYYCYFFEKHEYMKFEPVGQIHLHIDKANFHCGVANLLAAMLYKNRVVVNPDPCLDPLLQAMHQIDEKLTKALIKVETHSKNDIEFSKTCFLVEDELLTDEDLELIKSYLALDNTIDLIQVGRIEQIEKPSSNMNIGFILSPKNYFWAANHLQNPMANLRDASLYHLYGCDPEKIRKVNRLVNGDKLDDEFEYLDDAKRERIIQAKFQRILSIAKEGSKFYGSHLKNREEIPFLLPEHLRKIGYPFSTDLLTKPMGHCYFFSTGGSTGVPKTSVRAVKDQYAVGKSHGKGMQLTGFNEKDIVANLFSAGSMWAGFQTMNIALERTGCSIMPLANVLKPEELASVLVTYKANAIMGMPSLVLSLAKYVEHHPVEGLKINKILVGGELVSDKMKEYLMSIFELEVFSTACYSALDIGAIGYQCDHCSLDTYHINEDQVFLEVLNPESLAPVKQGEQGELVATHIERELMPIIRYRFGDQGRIHPEPCPCGRKSRLLQLFGRSDDTLIIGGHKVQPFNVESAISSIDELSLNFQMIADEVDAQDQFKLVVEANSEKLDKKTKARLEKELKEKTFKNVKLLDTASKIEGIKMPVFEVVPLNTLKRNARTGKLKRVIDLRQH